MCSYLLKQKAYDGILNLCPRGVVIIMLARIIMRHGFGFAKLYVLYAIALCIDAE